MIFRFWKLALKVKKKALIDAKRTQIPSFSKGIISPVVIVICRTLAKVQGPRLSQHAKDSCSIMTLWPSQTLDDQKPPHVLFSIVEEEHHLEKQRGSLQHGFDSHLSGILENVNGKKQGKLASNHFLWVCPREICTYFIFICFSYHLNFIFLLYLFTHWFLNERYNP